MNKYVASAVILIWYALLCGIFYIEHAMEHIISTVVLIMLPALLFIWVRYIPGTADFRLQWKGQLAAAVAFLLVSAAVAWLNPDDNGWMITAVLGDNAAWPLKAVTLFLCAEAGNVMGYAVAEFALSEQAVE